MSDIRYLLDENVNPLLRTELINHEPTLVVWIVGDPGAPPKGTRDPDVLRWCEEHSFILVTNNRRTMPVHLREHLDQGRHIPGIFELSPSMSIGENIEELLLIWAVSDEHEYRDQIVFLPLS